MWGGSGPDPGGTKDGDTSSGIPPNQELIDLKDQFEQQQVLIAQLKEMLRKTEQTTITQEKVEEYANTLTRMSARAKKNKLRKEGEMESKSEPSIVAKKTTTIDTPAKEKLLLLRQQVEENKQKLAERGKFQKGIEETVTQLKAQLADSQQLINQTSLNMSITEPKIENYSINSSQEELFNLVVNKDRRINEMNAKIQKLEANVLDLQENVKEKDSVIDARTKAITLMTESLSKKGKTTLDALDDTKEQMRKMQENFVTLEMEMKNEKQQLLIELEEKTNEIIQLKRQNDVLESSCKEQQEEILRLNSVLEEYKTSEKTGTETTGATPPEDLNNQIEVLNNRIVELERMNAELQEKPSGIATRDSPQRSSKKGKKGQKTQKAKSKESSDDSDTKVSDLQKQVDVTKAECGKHLNKITELELTISELNIQIEELKSKPIVQTETEQSSDEVVKLKKQLDESNKSMIKIKAQHKGKIKELNKKIEELKKGGDNEEMLKLQAENSRLSERIDILEEEKVNMGLDVSSSSSIRDSGASERVKELEIKLIEQTELTNSKNTLITTLEEQLETLKERFEKLSQLENAQVVSEITSIHFEEQLDKLEMEKRELIKEKEEISREQEVLLEKLETLTKDKQELNSKLDSYMQENMELIDKLEKLSAEKVSSAESIEIVEGLTQQEKLELEEYQKGLEMTSGNIKTSTDNLEENPELNESVNELTEETSDLLRKIELFTEERREVMEKMEVLAAENNQLSMKIHEIENNRDILADTYEHLQNEKEELENQLQEKKENLKVLQASLDELKNENEVLKEKLGCQEVKHGSEVEETIKLETVMALKSNQEEQNLELQSQINEYKKLIDIQQQEIQELRLELLSQKDLAKANIDLHEKITSLQSEYETLLSENEKLNKTIKETSEIVHEKDTIESELIDARKRIHEFNEKITNSLNEIENYKSIVEENKEELISSANLINDLQNKLQEKQNEIVHYGNEISHLNSVIAELNSAISHLESENHQLNESNNAMELMSNQLHELKVLLNENIKHIEAYEKELEQNSDTISKLNSQLKDVNNKLLEMEHDLECKDDEIKKLAKERDNKETVIVNLQSELKEKDENFHQVCNTLKEKYLALQSQIEENTGSLDNIKNPIAKIEELENKNKEQLEKMKKIAANLKKKTAAYQELEEKYKQKAEKWETEGKEKVELQEVIHNQETKITELQNKIDSLLEQLHEVEKEFATKAREAEDLNKDIVQLKIENEELHNLKQNYVMQLNTFTAEAELHRSAESNNLNMEINEKNEIIKSLSQELETVRYNSETNSNALHAKIQELEMFIETQESELTKYKEKVNKLEEGLSAVEERRLSLEQKAIELGAQLQEKSNSYEEISQTEDILEQRLAALMVHDEKIQRHLQETIIENQELVERSRFLIEENDQLKHKLSAATERNLDATTNQEKMFDLQTENLRLSEVIVNLESESKRLHGEYEKKINEKKDEVEALEVELQGQLEQLDNERKTLLMQCEQLQDQIKEYCETQELLKDDIEQYKQKLEQQQVDFDAYIIQFQQVNDENKKNLGIIEQLNSQLEATKFSSKDDSSTKTAEEHKKLLAEKDTELENYRQQNLQLQMQNIFGQNQPLSSSSVLSEELQTVKNHLAEYEKVNQELRMQNSELLEKLGTLEKHAHKAVQESQQPQPKENISTFVWPEQTGDDPFNFVLDVPATNPQVMEQSIQKVTETTQLEAQNVPTSKGDLSENTKEELLKKIKTLEFLLYDVEKEKEDVLQQCQELTNEIARLIYERQNVSTTGSTQLESQICPEKDTVLTDDERQQLREVEYAKSKECKDEHDSVQLKPVMEEIIEPTTTYLCYKPEAPPEDIVHLPQHHGTSTNLESLVVSTPETEITKEDLKQLQNLEFEKTKPHTSTETSVERKPVIEEVLQPKTAYLCYQLEAPTDSSVQHSQEFQHIQVNPLELQIVPNEEEDLFGQLNPEKIPQASTSAIANLDIFDENDDGWGCALEEVKLEEDNRQLMGTTPMNLNVNLRIEELDERIHVLEMERERHLEEIKQGQIKSGKLIKKLKEFKALNEKLTADLRKSNDFGGLDDAIQDELQSQIARLEKKIKECTAELEKEKTDKSNLTKKNETLQNANERLMEMKEKQDIEMLSWQRQNRELNAKLEQFEWGDGGFDSPKHSKGESHSDIPAANVDVQNLERKIQELNDIVKDLTLDNEELQTMLEEQRTLRINAEKAKSVEPIPENMKSETEYLSVVAEKNQLNEQLTSNVEEKKNLQEQLNNLIKSNGELQQQLQNLAGEKSHLEMQIVDNNNKLQELSLQSENLKIENQNLIKISEEAQSNELEKANNKIVDLEQNNSALSIQLKALEETTEELYSVNSNLSELKNTIQALNQEKADLFNALQEKNVQIENLNDIISEHNQNKINLEEKLNHCDVLATENKEIIDKLQSKDSELEELAKKLDLVLEERTTLSASIQQLAEEWNQRVDQRGTDVAESWKLHLEGRENEFMQVEQQLRKEMNELEEKCNALVNENNELRKNVDAEIRNEVDKISALQQQINDRQQYINDLTHLLQENQTKLEQQQQKLSEYESHALQLNQQIQEKNVRITEVEAKVLSLQLDIEEKSKIIEDLTQQLEEFRILQQHLQGNQNIILNLQHDLETKQKTIDEYLIKLDDSTEENEKYKESYTLLKKQIQDKDLYITEITNKLQEIELRKESEVNNDIRMLQQQVNELTANLQEKHNQIKVLNQQINNYQQYNEDFQVKEVEIKELKSEINNLYSLLNEKEKQYLQVQEGREEIERWNQQFKENLEAKESEIVQLNMEINGLKSTLNEKEAEYNNNLAMTTQESENVFHEKAQELDALKRRQAAAENHYEELIMAKDSDMASLQIQLQEQIQRNESQMNQYQEMEDTLNEFKNQLDVKERECEELQHRVFEQNTLHNEENKQLSELREIIEDQVMKIEVLKQELFEKSKDYDSLIAELDIRKPTRSEPSTPPPLEKQEEFMRQLRTSDIASPSKRDDQRRESETTQLISLPEMDLALYMLHQRDMRCEELTVELMQLLEERDTLQLKLSNTIREKEELRKRFLPLSSTPESGSHSNAKLVDLSITGTPKTTSKTSAIVLGATGTELATEATEHLEEEQEADRLATKLSELKSVGYRRDKTLLDEQEQRRFQQLSLMQQHRDVAAMLPAEAAAKLVQDANYTLSRDVQSPPRVLLNWLWGRSTPKVNDV